MSIALLPRRYEACCPGEKLHRLRVSYVLGMITLEELEERAAEVWVEWDEWDAKGLDPEWWKDKMDREAQSRPRRRFGWQAGIRGWP